MKSSILQKHHALFWILCSKALQSTGTDGWPLKRESGERFTRCTLCCRHGMYILGVIKKIVGKIDDTEYLEKLFDDLSDLHRRLGVEASGMDIFGKVFCKVGTPKNWKCETWGLCLENLGFFKVDFLQIRKEKVQFLLHLMRQILFEKKNRLEKDRKKIRKD